MPCYEPFPDFGDGTPLVACYEPFPDPSGYEQTQTLIRIASERAMPGINGLRTSFSSKSELALNCSFDGKSLTFAFYLCAIFADGQPQSLLSQVIPLKFPMA